jgi:uncharacterized small protein (DUF1192 family)
MSHGHATCHDCGHEWDLRKPHTEITRLRCSACGTTGDAITVAATTTGTVAPDELSIVERLHREERQTALQTRATRLMADIERLGDGRVPDGLAPTHTALETLTTELNTDELVATTELEAIEEYLTDKEEAVYSRETVTKVTDLEQRVEDLTAEVEQLEAEKAQLKRFLRHGRSLTDSE